MSEFQHSLDHLIELSVQDLLDSIHSISQYSFAIEYLFDDGIYNRSRISVVNEITQRLLSKFPQQSVELFRCYTRIIDSILLEFELRDG